jgi:hypothetical protein
MKPSAFSFVMVADQVGSRSAADGVPAALDALSGMELLLPFERTAGDEIQGLTDSAEVVVATVSRLTRLGNWRVGIGAGEVESPLPRSTRAARGTAYLAAREAIAAARHSPTDLALTLRADVSPDRYGETTPTARDAESALWLLRSVLARRSREGWELMDLLDQGLTNAQAAARLGISPSAVSQRLGRSARLEAQRGSELATRLLTRLHGLVVGAEASA